MTLHHGQLRITGELVSTLVSEQLPALAGERVRLLPQRGTVNAIARVGERLAARFPLQPGNPRLVHEALCREAEAARSLVGHVHVACCEPVALGGPGHGYPLPWSVQTWLEGLDAFEVDPGASTDFARDLADLVLDLRAVPTGGRTFVGEQRENRGGTIADHDPWVRTCLERSVGLLDVPRLAALWERLLVLPRGSDPDVTTHGDLVPGNVLVAGSGAEARLAGLLDVGGVGPADPALDLVGAWHLLDVGPRAVFRQRLDVGEVAWARGVAWAFEQAVGLVWYYRVSNPPMSRLGHRTLARILRAAHEVLG